MEERKGLITVEGNPLTLLGGDVNVGDSAPDVELLDSGLAAVKLSSFQGKVVIISSVPSLDTPVCDTMTRRFNEAAGALGGDVVVVTISTDLPFAQARWCGAAGVENVQALSDHRDVSFGEAFGLLIKELRLLARAVFVVDKEGTIRYKELVGELTQEPDYDGALENFARAVEIDPQFMEARLEMGATLEMQGKPREAMRHYEAAAKAGREPARSRS